MNNSGRDFEKVGYSLWQKETGMAYIESFFALDNKRALRIFILALPPILMKHRFVWERRTPNSWQNMSQGRAFKLPARLLRLEFIVYFTSKESVRHVRNVIALLQSSYTN